MDVDEVKTWRERFLDVKTWRKRLMTRFSKCCVIIGLLLLMLFLTSIKRVDLIDHAKNMSTDDFYIVLPSNGCSEKHPQNTANHFFNSWENPFNFSDGKWTVALTEANYYHAQTTINVDFAVEYTKINKTSFT